MLGNVSVGIVHAAARHSSFAGFAAIVVKQLFFIGSNGFRFSRRVRYRL